MPDQIEHVHDSFPCRGANKCLFYENRFDKRSRAIVPGFDSVL